MQKKLTWFLTVLALGLFSFIYFVERKVPSTSERGAAPRVFSVDTQNIKAVEITLREAGAIRAEQTNGTWFLTKPLYPAPTPWIPPFSPATANGIAPVFLTSAAPVASSATKSCPCWLVKSNSLTFGASALLPWPGLIETERGTMSLIRDLKSARTIGCEP